MKISEIFCSIDGEGIRSGYPVIFIRSYGCNLRCSYCDSRYACDSHDYVEMSVKEIIEEVSKYSIPKITFTGGEPLIHAESVELISNLTKDYEVNIETNGSVDLSILDNIQNRDNIIVTMDWKSKSSQMSDSMLVSNLAKLRSQDVLKFVVGDADDMNQMLDIIVTHDPSCNIFVSPVFGNIEPKEIVQFLLDHKLNNVRIQLQLHKLIWDPSMRGV